MRELKWRVIIVLLVILAIVSGLVILIYDYIRDIIED
jgi:hypothetical protein